MENLNLYIKEALVNNKIKSKYKYYPKTTDELIKSIKTELDKGNTNLNCIDTSNINNMSYLFDQEEGIKLTKEQQKTLDVSEWNVSNVNIMKFLFFKCKQFNCDLSNWDVSNVENMMGMFYNCEQFNSDLLNWNVFIVGNMSNMFYNCKKFNCDLSNWSVSNVKFMTDMFDGSGLEGNEPSWYKK